MLCHGGCGARVEESTLYIPALGAIQKATKKTLYELTIEDLLGHGLLCPDCALFRVATGQYWVRYTSAIALVSQVQVQKQKDAQTSTSRSPGAPKRRVQDPYVFHRILQATKKVVWSNRRR